MAVVPHARIPGCDGNCHFALTLVLNLRLSMGLSFSQQSETETAPAVIAAAFARALAAAGEWAGATSPNPPVGCVILDRAGRQLAIAAHRQAGTPHAEPLAIAMCRAAGTFDAIYTIIVTLEPCNHIGRTPPCTAAIFATPARQVWIGTRDPNPHVIGGGADALAAGGVDVRFIADLETDDGLTLSAVAARLVAPFAKHQRTGLPWVTVKQAIDRNGSMIPPVGRKTFTASPSLVLAHQLRKRADAILTGSGTVLADAPEFTVRQVADFVGKQRHLVILDRRGRVPGSYVAAAQERGFVVSVATDLGDALKRLGAAGVLEVLVEAGPQLSAAVLESGLWDEYVRIAQGATGQDDEITDILREPDFGSQNRDKDVFGDY